MTAQDKAAMLLGVAAGVVLGLFVLRAILKDFFGGE